MKLIFVKLLLSFALNIYKVYSTKYAKDHDKDELKKLRLMIIEATKFNGRISDVVTEISKMDNKDVRLYFEDR